MTTIAPVVAVSIKIINDSVIISNYIDINGSEYCEYVVTFIDNRIKTEKVSTIYFSENKDKMDFTLQYDKMSLNSLHSLYMNEIFISLKNHKLFYSFQKMVYTVLSVIRRNCTHPNLIPDNILMSAVKNKIHIFMNYVRIGPDVFGLGYEFFLENGKIKTIDIVKKNFNHLTEKYIFIQEDSVRRNDQNIHDFIVLGQECENISLACLMANCITPCNEGFCSWDKIMEMFFHERPLQFKENKFYKSILENLIQNVDTAA